jgi:hypothetical protein
MIRHCSLFKLKAGTSEQTRNEIVRQFHTLPGQVPNIRLAQDDVGGQVGRGRDQRSLCACPHHLTRSPGRHPAAVLIMG